jgi:hypothetical protein
VNVTEGSFLRSRGNTFFYQANDTVGYIILDCTLLGNMSRLSGNGALVTIQFYVKGSRFCDLDLYDTVLIDSTEQMMIHTVVKSQFNSVS